ncbi:hypothetical protein VC87395_001750 [Vibrio paracholerae 87395]|nr:hypothetical protein VC87395_001750 [Vibrio paracholerae 87395]
MPATASEACNDERLIESSAEVTSRAPLVVSFWMPIPIKKFANVAMIYSKK